MSEFFRQPFELVLRERRMILGRKTRLMGILNVTPDSFSDGGMYKDPGAAEHQALRMQREGADIIDVGGESTRPGAVPVSASEEIRRVRPVLKRLKKVLSIPLSIDTYKYDVAAMSLDEGVSMVNDIHVSRGLKRLARLVGRHRAGLTLMHMQGSPQTMQRDPRYHDLFVEIQSYLRKALDTALSAGVDRQSLVIDPGFGFGKSLEHQERLLSHLDRIGRMPFPLLVGLSRKSFIGALSSGAPVRERLYGSLAAASIAVAGGAHILRVHDVSAHCQLVAVLDHFQKERGDVAG